MSVAGILAGTLFSGAGAQFAQKAPLAPFNTSSAPSAFAAVQQQLLQSRSISPASPTSVPSEMSQLGQDLRLSNLSAAQADYSALKIAIAQHHTPITGKSQLGSAAGGVSNPQAGAIPDPSAAAMLAYSSIQQNPNTGALSSSLVNPTSTFSINA